MGQVLTFDFHNTLVRCDEWFDLEVRLLPVRVGKILGLPEQNDVESAYRALRRDVIAHGVEIDATDGVVAAWERVGVSVDRKDVAPLIDDMMRDLVPRSMLLEGVRESLDLARTSGLAIGVVSSAVHHDFLEWALTYHGVRSAFEIVVTSASCGFYKSRPEIYRSAIEQLGGVADQATHVGDSWKFDHLTSASLGIRSIWLNEEGQPVPDESPVPAAVIRSMTELPGLLLEFWPNGVDSRAD